MKVVHSDSDTLEFTDEAGMAFMTLTVHRLNTALIANGISSSETRRGVCENFLFEFAYYHDAGWLQHADRRVFPLVALATRTEPAEDANLGKIMELHVPTEASSWHEYANGVVARYFDEHGEGVGDLRSGSYGDED